MKNLGTLFVQLHDLLLSGRGGLALSREEASPVPLELLLIASIC